MRTLTLFYAWQMDHPSRICRDFIRRALDDAVALLAAEGIALKIDSDTQGVSGTPHVSDTILQKIRDCDLFLADVTFVAQAGDKLIPNPNVMTEYGYAMRGMSMRRVLLAMNTAFGGPTQLPFDLGHLRHPAQYEVSANMPDGARRAARTAFGAELATYILAAAQDARTEIVETERQRGEALRAAWWEAIRQRPLNDRPALVSSPSVVVHVVPAAALSPVDLDPREVRPHAMLLRLFDDAKDGGDGRRWWSHGELKRLDGRPNPESWWYGRLLSSGIMEFEVRLGVRIDDDPTIVVKGTRIESYIVEAADHGLQLCAALGLTGPFGVGVVLYGVEDLEVAGRHSSGRYRTPSVDLPFSLVPAGSQRAGDDLRKAFDVMWMTAGLTGGSPSYEQPEWKGYSD